MSNNYQNYIKKNQQFYNNYPIEVLRTKMEFYSQIYYNLEYQEFTFDHFRHLQDVFNSDSFLKFITQEIHMMSYHIIEAFFGLFFSLRERDEENLWLKLSFSEDNDSRGFLLYDQISEFRSPYHVRSILIEDDDTGTKYWKFLLYPKYSFPKSTDTNKILNDLSSIIYKLASRFSSRELYNAYKHGLRLFDGGVSSINVAPESSPGVTSGPFKQMAYTPQSFVHLVNKKMSVHNISLKTTAISTKKDIFLIENAIKLIENIIFPRRSNTGQVYVNIVNLLEEPSPEGNYISATFPMVSEVTIQQKLRNEFSNRQFLKAIVSSSANLRINQNNYEAREIRAASYYNLKKYNEAKEDYDILINRSEADPNLNPQWVNLLYYLSACNQFLGNEEKSVEEREKFVEKYDPTVHKNNLYQSILSSLVGYFFQKNQNLYKEKQRNNKSYLQKALKYQLLLDPNYNNRNQLYKILYFLSKVRMSKVHETYFEMMRKYPSNSMIKLNYCIILNEHKNFSKRDELCDDIDPSTFSSEEMELYEEIRTMFKEDKDDKVNSSKKE